MAIKKRRFFQKKKKKRKYSKFFSYKNNNRVRKNFMYKNFERSNSYNSHFTCSNFSFVNFEKATMKFCGFNGAFFEGAEFKNANLRGSRFKGTTFKNTIFLNSKLDNVSFRDATFENVFFIGSSIKNARGIKKSTPGITFMDAMPKVEYSSTLQSTIRESLKNIFIKDSAVLVYGKGFNTVNVDRLLAIFGEERLVSGLKIAKRTIDRRFYTLSYLVRFINNIEGVKSVSMSS